MKTIKECLSNYIGWGKQKGLPFPIGTGFESSRIIDPDKGLTEKIQDVLESSGHLVHFERDLELVKKLGITIVRVPVPWHRICPQYGVYDWSWMDRYIKKLLELGLVPIMDPLHHTSFPSWLTGGFTHPSFVRFYIEFIIQLVVRYPEVKKYTIINEPLVTNHFCTQVGVWYPFLHGDEHFIPALKNIAFAIRDTSHFLQKMDKEHVYIEASEHYKSIGDCPAEHAAWRNQTRFQLLDLLLGKITENHPLYSHFLKYIPREELLDFVRSPAFISTLGIDYYAHCEFEHIKNEKGEIIRRNNMKPIGFAAIALQYAKRYRLPIMWTETNIRGYVTDRFSWGFITLHEAVSAQKELHKIGVRFEGYIWFPFRDSYDWDSVLTKSDKHQDPVGILYDDENDNPTENEFSEMIRRLIKKEISLEDIVPYKFRPPLSEQLVGFIDVARKKWKKWREPVT